MPNNERKIARVFAAKRITSQVEVIGLKLTLRPGSVASARGMARAHRYMSTATATMVTAAARWASPPLAAAVVEVGASRPPAIVPTRMAMKVPASTSALPPTSSLWRRCCGISEYLSGPKMVASTPNRKITPSRIETWPTYSATAPQHISTTSAKRVWRISRLFSYLSASWPDNAENRKNGRMNKPCDTFASTPGVGGRCHAEGEGHHHRIAKQVVVEGAEELRKEERQEAAFAQQLELRRFCARNLFGKLHQAF